jgi:hypothetical protein
MAYGTAVSYLSNAAGTDLTSLALKIYSGVFMDTYRNQPKLWTRPSPAIHRQVAASGSKTYQWLKFAETPGADEDYHPGDELFGQGFAVDEGTNSVDSGYIVAHHKIPRYDMQVGHFEIMTRLAQADARQIGMTGDRRMFITAALAARQTSALTKNGLTTDTGGNRVTRTGGSVAAAYPLQASGAANFRDDLRALAYAMDIDNIPRENRELWITPYMEQVLLYDTTAQLFSKDYQYDGMGNQINMREVRVIEGFKLIDRVNTISDGGSMPNSNVLTGPSRYQGDFSVQASNGTPVAIVLAGGADGTGAISVGTWDQVANNVIYVPQQMCYFVQSAILSGISAMNYSCVGSIEVIT